MGFIGAIEHAVISQAKMMRRIGALKDARGVGRLPARFGWHPDFAASIDA
jgi:hypothetical protein